MKIIRDCDSSTANINSVNELQLIFMKSDLFCT